MAIRFADNDEVSMWDDLVQKNPTKGDFFQTSEFADTKKVFGWEPRYIITDESVFVALEKSVFGLGKIWYCPQGIGTDSAESTGKLSTELRAFAAKNGVFIIKLEPQLEKSKETRKTLIDNGLKPATSVQPTMSTIWLDIRPTIEDVEASFNTKVRYNIRQARKGNVVCKIMPAEESTYKDFYNLFVQTANGRFFIRPYEYYKNFWGAFCENSKGFIMFAYDGDTLASADFVMVLGNKASRKDAGSTPKKTTRGIPALVVLETIRELKKRGVTDYDLCGSPDSEHIKDSSHPLYGVGQFKSGFNNHVTDYIGTFEIPVSPFRTNIWTKYIEKLVRKVYFVRHHQSYY